jgi:hypothetical protein
LQKTRNWKFLYIFSSGSSPLKFYYIMHLCEMELPRKLFFFFQFFIKKLYFFLLNLNSLWKMCSFEVHHVDVVLRFRRKKWKIGKNLNFLGSSILHSCIM